MAARLLKTADRPLQSARVIVCEGADEFDVLTWIRTRRQMSESDFELIDANGRTNLTTVLGDLRYQSGGSGVKLVAVVLDAEERAPADLDLHEGLQAIAQDNSFLLALHVLPDSNSSGALETLVRRHVDVDAPAVSCADAWEACLAPTAADWTTAQKDKAWGHVWLAGQKAFYSRHGVALTRNSEVREHLSGVVQHFERVIDKVLNTALI